MFIHSSMKKLKRLRLQPSAFRVFKKSKDPKKITWVRKRFKLKPDLDYVILIDDSTETHSITRVVASCGAKLIESKLSFEHSFKDVFCLKCSTKNSVGKMVQPRNALRSFCKKCGYSQTPVTLEDLHQVSCQHPIDISLGSDDLTVSKKCKRTVCFYEEVWGNNISAVVYCSEHETV